MSRQVETMGARYPRPMVERAFVDVSRDAVGSSRMKDVDASQVGFEASRYRQVLLRVAAYV